MKQLSANRKTLFTTKILVLTALMTAVTCILGPMSLPLPFSPVPLTWTNLVIFLSAYILGCRYASVSCLLYLLLGLAGLPVFSGFSGGIGKLAGPTGGYLIGFIFLAVAAGFFIERFPDKKWLHAAGMAAGMLITYGFGTLWLSFQMGLTFGQGLAIGVIPYIPGDAAKLIAALIIGPVLKKRLRPFLTNV